MGIFFTALYQPLFNLLIWLHNVIPGADFGFAIIGLTVLVKLALWPLSHAALKSQKRLQDIQPKLEELKKKHADDKEALAKSMMELYQGEKVNPLSSCLPLLIQLPILLALFRVLRDGTISDFSALYPSIAEPAVINNVFLGIFDLAEKSIILALIAGGFQFIQTKMLMARRAPKDLRDKKGAKDEDMMAAMNKSMMYFMPLVTVVIGASFPAGLTVYWVSNNIITIVQQFVAFRKKKEQPDISGETKVIDVEVTEKPETKANEPLSFPTKK